MDCKQVAETLFLFFDNELDEGLEQPFRAHLEHCPCCARQHDHTRRVLILVRQHCVRATAPQHLRVRILTSLPHRQRLS